MPREAITKMAIATRGHPQTLKIMGSPTTQAKTIMIKNKPLAIIVNGLAIAMANLGVNFCSKRPRATGRNCTTVTCWATSNMVTLPSIPGKIRPKIAKLRGVIKTASNAKVS